MQIVFCRGDRIRTCDHLVPNQVRYRTALRPELRCKYTHFLLYNTIISMFFVYHENI